MAEMKKRKLVLEDGTEYYGEGFGSSCEAVCDIVFNTSTVGYQEIISDPSYTYQAVVMTYPLIGNYGIADEDFETKVPTLGGLIVREYNDLPSNFRYTKTLSEVMEEYRIPGLSGPDTRAITRHIRDNGGCRGIITDADTPKEKALETIARTPVMHDAVEKVSCKKRWYSRTANAKYNVVAIDCGIKLGIIHALNRRGCNVTVMPYNTPAAEVEKMKPDGIIISNGPGAPDDAITVIELVKKLRGKYPIFGIGLGHEIIALACGAEVEKLSFAHCGGAPVRRLADGKIESTAQNNGYTVKADSLEGSGLEVTHVNVVGNAVAGLRDTKSQMFSIQYHPESAPGPQDSEYLFDEFVNMMEENRNA